MTHHAVPALASVSVVTTSKSARPWRTPLVAAAVAAAAMTGVASAQDSTLAILTFENGSIADVSGKGVTTALVGTPTFGAGIEGGGIVTSGTSGVRVDVNINPAVRPQLTMGGWVYSTTINPTRHLLSHDNTGYDRDLCIDTRGGGTGWSAFAGTGVVGYVPAVANQWQFVAAVYDDTAGTVLLYVDGVTRTATGRHPGPGNTYLRVGLSTCCDSGIIGSIDGIFILAEALSVARLDEIRAGGIHKAPTCPAFFSSPSSQAVCPGKNVTLAVDAAGSGTLTYQWRKGGVPLADQAGHISGSQTPTLAIANSGAGDTGSYDCLVTNACAPAGAACPAFVLNIFCPNKADVAGLGGAVGCDGQLTADDIVVYLAAFFANDFAVADIASLGGAASPDGRITADDLIAFLAAFFAGCP